MNISYLILTILAWVGSLAGINYVSKRLKKNYRYTLYGVFLLLTFGGIVGIYRNFLIHMGVGTVKGMPVNSRVVWVKDSNAPKGWDGQTYDTQIDQAVVTNMYADGLKSLTGQTTTAAAWSWLFTHHNTNNQDYQPGEKVAVKINNDNAAISCTTSQCASVQVLMAVIDQLVNTVGVSQPDILVFDAANHVTDYQKAAIQAVFPNVAFDINGCSTDVMPYASPLANDLVNAKYFINIPNLRTDTDAGVSLSFKNNVSSTCEPGNFTTASYFYSNPAANSLVVLNSDTNIKDKTLLVLGDGLFGLKAGGPDGDPDGSNGISPYPASLFLAIDPVAADSVMIDYLTTISGVVFGSNDPRTYMTLAAGQGLGTYETSCTGMTCDFSYQQINLVRCDNVACPATSPLITTPTDTPTQTPTSTLTPTLEPTATPTETASPTPTETAGVTPTVDPSITPSVTPQPTMTPEPTVVPTAMPTPTGNPQAVTVTVSGEDMQIDSLISSGSLVADAGSQANYSPNIRATRQINYEISQSQVTVPMDTNIRAADTTEIDLSKFKTAELDVNQVGGLSSDEHARGSLQWGIPSFGLTFDKPLDVSLNVSGQSDGKRLYVYRSSDGQGHWSNNGILGETCTVSGGKCVFQTTKASYFVAAERDASSNNNSSSSGGSSGPPGPPVCTAERPWSAPHLYKIIKTDAKTVKLTIAPGAGPVDYYYVSYGEKKGWDQHGVVFSSGYSSGSLVFTVGNLKPNKVYYFRVRNGNGCMPGYWDKEGASTKGKGTKNIK